MKENKKIKFIDFCAGVGAGRIGLESAGFECAAFSEIDKNSEKTYREFFGQKEKNYGDLMKVKAGDLPDFDLLIAGFPCQTFSFLGKRMGMSEERGQIIYGLARILKDKKPAYFILENVRGLVGHNKGKTLKTILRLLDMSGYEVFLGYFGQRRLWRSAKKGKGVFCWSKKRFGKKR